MYEMLNCANFLSTIEALIQPNNSALSKPDDSRTRERMRRREAYDADKDGIRF